jgi:alpha-glucoside transport system substrate-binding protein
MFNDPPNCYMHRQATFIPAFFPEDMELVANEDYGFFRFPDIDGNSGALIAGGLAAIFNNRPEIKDFLDNYITPEVQCLIGSGDATQISGNVNVDVEACYENEIIQQAAGIIQEALNEGVARFDASDLMPPAVGSGEFWNGMNNYTDNGPDNLQEVLSAIDAAWPES